MMNVSKEHPSGDEFPFGAALSQVLDPALRQEIESCLPQYPTKRAALLPTLHLVQERLGQVSPEAVREIARLLELSPAQVQDTLGFYGFFKQHERLGRFCLRVCRSLSCAARGGEDLLEYLCRKLSIRPGQTTADGLFTLEFAECLGACDMAPAILVNDTLHGNMTTEKIDDLLKSLAAERDAAGN